MTKPYIEPGDIVVIKTPLMTSIRMRVNEIRGNFAHCFWIEKTTMELHFAYFLLKQLVTLEEV